MASSAKADLSYYLGLKYPVEITEQAEGGYFVRVPDLPGCMSQGETVDEALANIDEARRLWLEVAHESGDEIPRPGESSEFSGKFVLRVPRYLHEELARAADRESVSLNTYVLSLVSSGHAGRSAELRIEKSCSALERAVRGLTRMTWNLGELKRGGAGFGQQEQETANFRLVPYVKVA
jgi:predicted RNase H-like HicB family nuclease